VSKNHYIDLDPAYTEIEESLGDDSDLHDEISRKFVLIAKQKGISISKKKQPRNHKVWARRNSHQFELE